MGERAWCWACDAGPGRVAILQGRDVNGTAGARGRRGGARSGASQGGWVSRSAHRLVRPLSPGDGPMDPSP
jgi:hypothetical protein